MQKIFLFLIMTIARVIAKVVTSSWYQEAQRSSGLTPKRFAANSAISVTLLLGLVAFCLAVNL